jgi:hypothetical protein
MSKQLTSNNSDPLYQGLSYHERLDSCINNLPPHLHKNFHLAISTYKFDKEIYIPKNLSVNKVEYQNKNYLLNSLVSFNNRYQNQKKYMTELKSETDKFSHQYELVKSDNEKNKHNYLANVQEMYKIKGYNMKDLLYARNENIFNPSLLLEADDKLDIICKTESNDEIKKENKYLEHFQKVLKNKSYNKNDNDEKEKEKEKENLDNNNLQLNLNSPNRKHSSLIVPDSYADEMEKIKQKIMEEIKTQNMSLKALKKINNDLKREISITQNSIIDCNEEYKNRHQYIEETFLSSKGMVRSGKRRGDNDKLNKKKNKKINKTFDNEDYESQKDIFSIDDESNNINLNDSTIKNDNQKLLYEIGDNIKEINEINNNDNLAKQNKNRGSYLINNPKISEINDIDENNYIKHKKTEKTFEKMMQFNRRKNQPTTAQKKNYEEEKKRKKKFYLQKVYNNIIKNNFKSEAKEISNYIKLYTDKKITPVNNKVGSNLHGFMGEFKKKVNSTDVADLAKKVNDEKRNIYNKKLNSKNDDYNSMQSMMLNVDNLMDINENINKLEYDYAEQLLELK